MRYQRSKFAAAVSATTGVAWAAACMSCGCASHVELGIALDTPDSSVDGSSVAVNGFDAGAGGGTVAAGSTIASASGGAPATSTDAGDECLSVTNGYVKTDEFGGYAYTFATQSNAEGAHPATISPNCDTSGCTPNFATHEICASGIVGQATDGATSAGVTFNVNQPNDSDPYSSPFGTSLGSYGLRVDYSNTAGSRLRVQLIDSAWKTYCYELPPASGTSYISWGRFSTSCWNDSGSEFSPQVPIFGIQLMVPGDLDLDTSFNFCLSCVRTFSALQ